MSWNQDVSGGVKPPVLIAADAGRIIATFELPTSAALTETFETVSVRKTALDGALVDSPRGFRYRARVHMPYVEVSVWRGLAAAFSAYRAGADLLFRPHGDYPKITYAVAPAADFAFPYVAGKYLGYAGTLELVGTTLLDYIPTSAVWNYFCAADEQGYGPNEISLFTDADENRYAFDEPSLFSPADGLG